MDELRQQVADLEIQEGEIIGRLNAAETDEEAKSITNELNFVRNRKAEVELELSKLQEKEQQRAEVIEEKTHAAEIPFAVAGIDFTELPAEVITLIDVVVKADRRRLLNEHAIELEQEEERWKTELENVHEWLKNASGEADELRIKTDELLEGQKELNFKLDDVKRVNANLNELLADAESKRDAAVREKEDVELQLESANEEIRRLNDVIVDYQRAQEYNNRQTEQVTANDEEKASIIAAVEAVKKRYAGFEDWGSSIKVDKPDGSFELVKRKEFEEEWQSVDVPSFRPEGTTSDTQDNNVPSAETAATLEPHQFHTEEQTVQTNILLRESTTEGLGDVAQVTRQEFEALVKRVEALEGNSVQEAA